MDAKPATRPLRRLPRALGMWSKIIGLFPSHKEPLSDGWVHAHCTPMSLPDLQARFASHGDGLVFHATDSDSANLIVKHGAIFGEDVVASAHFHPNPLKTPKQAKATGCLLGFVWLGKQRAVDLALDPTTHSDRSPFFLVHVPNAAGSTQIWESRIYPGTTAGLLLVHFVDKRGGFLLFEPRPISVVQPHA